MSLLVDFLITGSTSSALGDQLLMAQYGLGDQKRPMRHQPRNPFISLDRLGGHVLIYFFCICFQASFFVEFWDSCFMYVGFILTHFLNIS